MKDLLRTLAASVFFSLFFTLSLALSGYYAASAILICVVIFLSWCGWFASQIDQKLPRQSHQEQV